MPLPYSYTLDEESEIASFAAENQASYKALFLNVPFKGEPQLEGLIYDFTFERDSINCLSATGKAKDGTFKKLLGRTDERIPLTLVGIVEGFFQKYQYAVVYFTCDSVDGKHKGRLQMFNDWYDLHGQCYIKVPFCVGGGIFEDGQALPEIVGGAIFLASHPLSDLIERFVNSEVIIYSESKSSH